MPIISHKAITVIWKLYRYSYISRFNFIQCKINTDRLLCRVWVNFDGFCIELNHASDHKMTWHVVTVIVNFIDNRDLNKKWTGACFICTSPLCFNQLMLNQPPPVTGKLYVPFINVTSRIMQWDAASTYFSTCFM